MDPDRLLTNLDSEFALLRTAVSATDAAAPVPSCPGWTSADLARHVGEVYLHKTLAVRDGVEPEEWPPPHLADEAPLSLLDRAYADLVHELRTREPASAAGGWYTPDRTVGFWIRRMAHETLVHRIDAELAAGTAVSPVADDMALDGCDEVLRVFTEFSVREWGDYFRDALAASPGRSVAIRAGDSGWRVRTGPGTFAVDDDTDGDGPADATVAGPPSEVLRWLWNREGGMGAVETAGAPAAISELRACLTVSTQ